DGQYLLTAGTDNTIRRWKLGTDGSELVKAVFGRTGDVGHVNLTKDGRFLFSDHGDELRILDAKTLELVNVVNSRRSGRFVQFALFSPINTLAIAAPDQGRNLLIRLPKLPEAPSLAPIPAAPAKTSPALAAPVQPSVGQQPTSTTMTTAEHWQKEGT